MLKEKAVSRINLANSKSVADRIKKVIIFIVIVSMIILGIVSCWLNYYSTMSSLENDMNEMAKIVSERVEWQITSYKNVVQELGCTSRLSNETSTKEVKQEVIDEKVKEYNCIGGKFIKENGIADDGIDYSDREYFKQAMNGKTFASDPLISKIDSSISIVFSAPVWQGGIKGTKVVGVVFLNMQSSLLDDIVKSIKVSDNASAYMINSKGITIAHENSDLVKNMDNTSEDAKTDSSLNALAAIEQKMAAGESGYGKYRYNGVTKLIAYSPVKNTDGWSIALNAPVNDFMFDTYLGIGITVGLIIIFVVLGYLIANKVGKDIGNPIKKCADRLTLMAKGDLKSEVPQVDTKDEVGILSNSARELADMMNNIISDVNYLLGTMADGDFTVHSQCKESYIGDFTNIIVAMRNIKTRLKDALGTITESSAQVALGSEQLSDSAQALAEGATEQAGAVQELTATIENVTEISRQSAAAAHNAYSKVGDAVIEADKGTEDMEKLIKAMESINQTSVQIQDIIADIESIASQTNLLSLNASIEAARAGEAGKGFAVVAEQIGKLASDSAQSAVNTRELIVTSLAEIEKGNEMTKSSAEIFEQIINSMKELSGLVNDVSKGADNQEELLEQVGKGVEQISSVVQSNSATAEETSATSEELSAQTETMNQQLLRFKL